MLTVFPTFVVAAPREAATLEAAELVAKKIGFTSTIVDNATRETVATWSPIGGLTILSEAK